MGLALGAAGGAEEAAITGEATSAAAEASPPDGAMSPVPPIEQSLLLAFLANNETFTLLDARSPEEFGVGHLYGAKNVPHDAVEAHADALPADRDAPIVVYCKTGKRAAALKERLVELGYSDVRILGPQQIVWSDTAPMFNCGVPDSQETSLLSTK
ncbi:MAG TPA: rhodanese-like domain-containing protein [Gammaproteobacteria bacterium]